VIFFPDSVAFGYTRQSESAYDSRREQKLSLLDTVRLILAEMRETKPVFHPAELQRFAYENCQRFKLPFEYGLATPYSQRLDDVLSFLLLNGEIEISSEDSCELIISNKLKNANKNAA